MSAHIVEVPSSREDRVIQLVDGDQVLGRAIYYSSTGQVASVVPHTGPIHDRLVQEVQDRGLLHGKDIPDHLQHDQEHL